MHKHSVRTMGTDVESFISVSVCFLLDGNGCKANEKARVGCGFLIARICFDEKKKLPRQKILAAGGVIVKHWEGIQRFLNFL